MTHIRRKPDAFQGHLILEKMPLDPKELAEQFRTMDARKFDAVCCSAIVYVIEDIQQDTGFVSVGAVATMVNAMRDRYHKLMESAQRFPRPKMVGERNPKARANEWQVRIIRRIRGARQGGISTDNLGPFFGLSRNTVSKIRMRKTWRHLDRRAA